MEDQAKHNYKKVETEKIVNVYTIKQEVKVDKLDKIIIIICHSYIVLIQFYT